MQNIIFNLEGLLVWVLRQSDEFLKRIWVLKVENLRELIKVNVWGWKGNFQVSTIPYGLERDFSLVEGLV